MNTTATDNATGEQLKLALAKMLPDKIGPATRVGSFQWIDTDIKPGWRIGEIINDTEWLHVCWLAEQALTNQEKAGYAVFLTPNRPFEDYGCFASWQSRAIALCRVKGIEI